MGSSLYRNLFPLLHALVVNALMLLKGNPFAYTRLPRCAARAR
jgi:hypothetical protein